MSTQYGASFTFDGVQTTSYGVWVSGINTYAAPERDVETVAVAGRNGLLTLDNGRYQNVKITYPCFMSENFDTDFGAFKAAMLSKIGYLELIDTYHPEGFRLARLIGGVSPKTGILNKSAKFDVQFDCYPQFFLSSGNVREGYAAARTLTNPTSFPAKPLVDINWPSSGAKTGTVTINGQTITITSASEKVYIDCETQSAYYLSGNERTSANSVITLTTGAFPTLAPGSNGISFTGNIASVGVTPRWWTL